MNTLSGIAPAAIESALEHADIRLDGSRPWDVRVHDGRMFARVLSEGSLGLGEAYMDGMWDCDNLDEFFYRVLRSHVSEALPVSIKLGLLALRFRLLNPQTILRSKKVAKQHYDLGNEFYASMLDPYMQYSCGYFKETDSLNVAQEQKLDLICRKLQLKKDERLLDIGCGWGGLAKFAAERYGAHVTGITISHEQAAFASNFCKNLPVEVKEMDYREITGDFDKIVSVGMFEHVGEKNYDTYMSVARRCLNHNGLFLLHSIGIDTKMKGPDPWLEKYIFPNSILPSPHQITKAFEGKFQLEDWHNFGPSYERTLLAWHANFERNWLRYRQQYGERFRRMWRYYLLSCAGAFRARSLELWQLVLSTEGLEGGYASVR